MKNPHPSKVVNDEVGLGINLASQGRKMGQFKMQQITQVSFLALVR
jgi:hypothetical protein